MPLLHAPEQAKARPVADVSGLSLLNLAELDLTGMSL